MAKVFSNEDGNQSSSIRVTRDRLYSDLDLTFSARTTTDGDVFKKSDVAAVKQSIKNLLLTNFNEKPYRPRFGGNLGGLLFELQDEDTGREMYENIERAIELYEPRARILNTIISSNPDRNSVSVKLEFEVVNTPFTDTLKVNITTGTGAIPVVPVVTPPPVFDDILLAQEVKLDPADSDVFNRIQTEAGMLLKVEFGQDAPFGTILTVPDGDWIITQDNQLLLEQNP